MTVTREPEWDDYERDKMLALGLYEAAICECGYHESVADQNPSLEFEFRVCPICKDLAKGLRKIDAADDAAKKALGPKPDPEAYLPDDGRHLRLIPKAPDQEDR